MCHTAKAVHLLWQCSWMVRLDDQWSHHALANDTRIQDFQSMVVSTRNFLSLETEGLVVLTHVALVHIWVQTCYWHIHGIMCVGGQNNHLDFNKSCNNSKNILHSVFQTCYNRIFSCSLNLIKHWAITKLNSTVTSKFSNWKASLLPLLLHSLFQAGSRLTR